MLSRFEAGDVNIEGLLLVIQIQFPENLWCWPSIWNTSLCFA